MVKYEIEGYDIRKNKSFVKKVSLTVAEYDVLVIFTYRWTTLPTFKNIFEELKGKYSMAYIKSIFINLERKGLIKKHKIIRYQPMVIHKYDIKEVK